VVAIIAANLIGLIGLLLAAPVLATVTLVGRYTIRKMLDHDPWADVGELSEPMGFPKVNEFFNLIGNWWKSKIRKKGG
jgi:hypothetical protein